MFSSILLGAALFGSAVAVPSPNGINQEPISGYEKKFSEGDEFPTNPDGTCQGGLYIAKEIPTHLYEVDKTGDHTFAKLHDCDGVHAGYNAIGYNVGDNFIYGVARGEHASGDGGGSDDAHMVIRINKNGCTEDVLQLPPNTGHGTGRHISADVHKGFLWAGRANIFRQVRLTPVDGKHDWIEYTFTTCTNMNDFAFAGEAWSSDAGNGQVSYGDAFGWDVQAGQFCQFKATFSDVLGTREKFIGDFGLKALLEVSSLKIGAFFMDKDGAVYMYENDLNTLYKITGFAEAINTGSNVAVEWEKELTNDEGGDPEDNNVDGASCADAPGEFGCLSIDKRCCDFDV